VVNVVTGQMLLTTLGVAIFGIAAAILLTWLLTRPILDLVATTQRVGEGDLAARASHWADDEIGALADAFNQMVAQLKANRESLIEKEAARTQLLQMLITAQEEERRRIARELHDGVGQVLTSFIVGNKLASQLEDREAARRKNLEIAQVATETLEQVRMLSRQLRPSLMDDLGLAAALERYVADFRRLYPEMTVDLHCDLGERLPEPLETTLYRIIQEAMTNAARHSGSNFVGVLVARRSGRVQAIIEDHGRGFDVASVHKTANSVGIHAMSERAELVGGRLDIESNDEGTTVYVEVPL
jgi:signal transduction histidine kinase